MTGKCCTLLLLVAAVSGCGTYGVKITDRNLVTNILAADIKKETGTYRPVRISENFSLEDKICSYNSFTWDDIEQEGGPQTLEYRWYTNDKLVGKRNFSMTFKTPPQSTWACITAPALGIGSHHVELYVADSLISSRNFSISQPVANK